MKKQFIFIVVAIILTSCNSLAVNTQSPSPSATPAPSTADSSTQAPLPVTESPWKTYTNPQVGFSIQYPSNWQEQDLPDENAGQMHHVALKGTEGGVELTWGIGLGGACPGPEGYQPIAVAKGSMPACHSQRADGTEVWSLAGASLGETSFDGFGYTNDTTEKSRAVVLKVISTLSFP